MAHAPHPFRSDQPEIVRLRKIMRKGVLERARVFITALALAMSASFLCFAPSNKSMDVRAKQLLFYHVAFLLSAGLMAVSPHVISAVRHLALLRQSFLFMLMKTFN